MTPTDRNKYRYIKICLLFNQGNFRSLFRYRERLIKQIILILILKIICNFMTFFLPALQNLFLFGYLQPLSFASKNIDCSIHQTLLFFIKKLEGQFNVTICIFQLIKQNLLFKVWYWYFKRSLTFWRKPFLLKTAFCQLVLRGLKKN